MQELIGEIHRAGERAAALTRQLLAFSRQQMLTPRDIDLVELMRGTERMLSRVIGEDIEVVTQYPSGPAVVHADPGQIEQVIMNLAVNARDAMPDGGTLTLEVERVELDEAYVTRKVVVQPGSYVVIAVHDTGTGIAEALQDRVFEPFFTTKEVGKGTGLGLATVYGIVKQSGGYIWLYSEPGHGSTFRVYLPAVIRETRHGAATAEPAPGGNERILLVEDDDLVRGLARRALEHRGYTIMQAAGPEAALELAAAHEGRIDLLLTDVIMPGMSGRALAERLVPLRPDMKVLYSSGYTDEAIVRHGVLEEGIAFLQKPYTPDSLARKVREVLDGSAPA
jgi:CheY-like chemotaxis protein